MNHAIQYSLLIKDIEDKDKLEIVRKSLILIIHLAVSFSKQSFSFGLERKTDP